MEKVSHIKEYIYSIDFSNIISKLVKYGGWLLYDANNTCELYRNFLFLNYKYGNQYGPLPPSEDIDEFWHSHILDTEAYIANCQAIFGKYFHHYPYLGIDGKTDMEYLNKAFSVTQKLHFQEFNYYLYPTHSSRSKLTRFFNIKLANFKKSYSISQDI